MRAWERSKWCDMEGANGGKGVAGKLGIRQERQHLKGIYSRHVQDLKKKNHTGIIRVRGR